MERSVFGLSMTSSREFIEAGADVILTNSFSANRLKLRPHGLEEKVYDINKKAADIAREAANNQLFVAVYNQGFFYYDEVLSEFVKLNVDRLTQEVLYVKKMFFDNKDHLWMIYNDNQLGCMPVKMSLDGSVPEVGNLIPVKSSIKFKAIFFH